MCAEFDLDQQPLTDLIAADKAGGLPAVRKLTECPGCILATLTASDDRWRPNFDFKSEILAMRRDRMEIGFLYPV